MFFHKFIAKNPDVISDFSPIIGTMTDLFTGEEGTAFGAGKAIRIEGSLDLNISAACFARKNSRSFFYKKRKKRFENLKKRLYTFISRFCLVKICDLFHTY